MRFVLFKECFVIRNGASVDARGVDDGEIGKIRDPRLKTGAAN